MSIHRHTVLRLSTGCLVLMLLAPVVPAADKAPQDIDREWRERFVMGYDADVYRNRARVQAQAIAEFEASRHSTDPRMRLQAAARYFYAIDDDSADCKVLDESLRDARAAGPQYQAELFDLAIASVGSGNGSHCQEFLSMAELEALARALGDPARMYYVLEARSYAAMNAGRVNELLEIRARQADYAIADFQRAYTLWARAQAERIAGPGPNRAEALFQQALALTDSREFEALHLHQLVGLHRAAVDDKRPAVAQQYMQRALPGVLSGVVGARDSAYYLSLFARHLAQTGETQRALDLLDRSRGFHTDSKLVSMYRSRTLLEIYAALGTPGAYAKGMREVRNMEALLKNANYFGPGSAHAAKLEISSFFEAFGRYEAALDAIKDANQAAEARQKLVNEKARVELQERLHVAAKEKENAELKSQAELQAARQRGWIIAFGVAACGVAGAAGALGMAVRRGRRLTMVTADLKQRSALLTAACHDLRQPVHALGMLTELGSDVQPHPDRFSEWLQSVRRSAASLSEMLDELMDLGRLDSGQYTPHLSDVSLADVLHDIQLHFGSLARRKGLTLELAQTQCHVVSDRHLLRRILFNLISNAIRYTDAGFVRVEVHLASDGLQLTVRDSGPGIPPEKVEHAFRDYVRLNPIKAGEGLGIGLPIVRRAADLLRHDLHLVSSPGGGTAASLRLPLSVSARPAEAPAQDHARQPARTGTIALLEDDMDVREAVTALLLAWGYTVRAAGNVPALLAESPGVPFKPDLLITDLHLVGTTGLEAIAALREALQEPDLPALLITGDLDPAITSQAALARAYLANKPLVPSKLDALVRQLINPQAAAPLPAVSKASVHSWLASYKSRKARH